MAVGWWVWWSSWAITPTAQVHGVSRPFRGRWRHARRQEAAGAGPYESITFTHAGRVVDIRGLDETVAQFGHTSGTHSWGSGGWGEGYNVAGKPGQTGVVIVAYQIGTSSSREIALANAERAGRSEGMETGYDLGVIEGYEQRSEEIRAMTEQVKEALPTKDKK